MNKIIVIQPNGDATACCGTSDSISDMINTPLYIGNCNKEAPEEVFGRKNQFCIRAFFNPSSPIWFKKFLEQASYKERFGSKKYSHICEFCKEILHIKEISRKVMEYDPY